MSDEPEEESFRKEIRDKDLLGRYAKQLQGGASVAGMAAGALLSDGDGKAMLAGALLSGAIAWLVTSR